MDPLTAAALAGLVAWISILVVIHLPGMPISVPGIRRVGAATIALLGLQVLGAPVPSWLPLVTLVGGGLLVAFQPRGAAAA